VTTWTYPAVRAGEYELCLIRHRRSGEPGLAARHRSPEVSGFDVDRLPPTQYMVLDVLAARYRLGEKIWTFPSRLSPAITALEQAGLVFGMHGIVGGTIRAGLTGAGRDAVLYPDYVPPVARECEP
jgi:hypothetical protein